MPGGKKKSDFIKSTTKNNKVIYLKKKRNYKKLFFTFLLFISVIAVALFTPIFNIDLIEVVGNEKFTNDEVINMSGIYVGQNLFKVNYFKAKDSISANQYIEKVKISRHYPNKVRITIEERKPAAYFQFLGSYLLVNKNGIVLDVLNSLNGLKIPSILGIKFKDYKLGDVLNVSTEDKPKFEVVVQYLNELVNTNNLHLINKFDINDYNKIVVWAYNEKFQINLADSQKVQYKVSFLSEILQREKDEKGNWVIDFSTPNKPTFKPRN